LCKCFIVFGFTNVYTLHYKVKRVNVF